MNIKGEKGQKFFDSAQKIADYFVKNKITAKEEVEFTESMRRSYERYYLWTRR